MQISVFRSAGAIVAACLVAFLAVALAPLLLLYIAGWVSPAYLEAHSDLFFAVVYATGTVAVGLLAGTAVGLVAPGRPAIHMLCAAAIMAMISLAIGGTATLARGWQVVGLVLQVALASAAAVLTWRRAHRGLASVSLNSRVDG